jgi:hypothetical protein
MTGGSYVGAVVVLGGFIQLLCTFDSPVCIWQQQTISPERLMLVVAPETSAFSLMMSQRQSEEAGKIV